MFRRLLNISKTNSFFLFGARGTGKSTWTKTQLSNAFEPIELLLDEVEQRYLHRPDLLSSDLAAKYVTNAKEWIVIDEIQKVPKLLDVIHHEIEKNKRKFVLTGSSARKLKRNFANLLAGRAFVKYLFPLTSVELDQSFDLDFCLHWGSLAKIFSVETDEDRALFLRAYAQTYLKEEILLEQLIRNGQSFRDFMLIAALENGNTLNFSKMAKDIGVDTKTIQNFFSIMEDTLVGFFLPAFHRPIRKSQLQRPKFYLFDPGVKRAMEGTLKAQIVPRTQEYGRAFEHWIILEFFRINSYTEADFRMSHYQEVKGGEIDLLLTRGRETWAIEIKSTDRIDTGEVEKLAKLSKVIGAKRTFYISQDRQKSIYQQVTCLHWQDALREIFLINSQG